MRRMGGVVLMAACLLAGRFTWGDQATQDASPRILRAALVQFDAVPEQPERNLKEIERLAKEAVAKGARLVMFHEGTICDYTPKLAELAEEVPGGRSCKRVAALAKQLGCYVSFGLSERAGDRFYITQVFCGPQGKVVYSYRKAWLWREPSDKGYRNEHARYDPGSGPEAFTIDGIRATCFICADGEAPRCIERAKALQPQLVFYPNNRCGLPDIPVFGERAKQIGAPMLVTNRTGKSWVYNCQGGCVAYDGQGNVLAKANRDGREEILMVDLKLPAAKIDVTTPSQRSIACGLANEEAKRRFDVEPFVPEDFRESAKSGGGTVYSSRIATKGDLQARVEFGGDGHTAVIVWRVIDGRPDGMRINP